MTRFLVAECAGFAVCAGLLLFANVSQAQTEAPAARPNVTDRTTMRQEIRQTPLLERPNRPGHFYGNTVRRLHKLQVGRN